MRVTWQDILARCFANYIDYVISLFLFFLLFNFDWHAIISWWFLINIVHNVIQVFCNAYFKRTVGKATLSLEIIGLKEEGFSFMSALKRQSVDLVIAILLIFLRGIFVWWIFPCLILGWGFFQLVFLLIDTKKRTLRDLIADSRVVGGKLFSFPAASAFILILAMHFLVGFYVKRHEWDGVVQLADRGDGVAQMKVGNAYFFGRNVKQNYIEALRWYERASLSGNIDAENNAGWIYEKGLGVEIDIQHALKLYSDAAKKGSPAAQEALGKLYENGLGVKRDLERAIQLYQLAKKSGYRPAEEDLKRLGTKK